jgi:hypothetical protein
MPKFDTLVYKFFVFRIDHFSPGLIHGTFLDP